MLSAFLDVPEFSLILCAMIGLGVGIDYALFIVTRHRQHLHEGMSVEDAAGTAIATAGQAVLFAGTTVVIAILGLFLAGLPAISGDGRCRGARRDRLDGRRHHAAARPARPGRHEDRQALDPPQDATSTKPADETVAGRWAHHVGSHPVRYAIVGLGALCAIAVPALSMRIGVPDDGNAATHTTQRIAYDQLAAGFGPGFNGPIQVVVELPTPADRGAVDRVHDALQADPGVAAVTAPVFNAAGDTARAHRQPDHGTAGRAHRPARPPPPLRRAAGHRRRHRRARVSLTGQAMVTDLDRPHHRAGCRSSSPPSWRCRSCC